MENIVINNKVINKKNIDDTIQVLVDNGIEEDEAEIVLQAIGYSLLDIELIENDDED